MTDSASASRGLPGQGDHVELSDFLNHAVANWAKVVIGENEMHAISLADELADTRAEIARLKMREATLRAAILEQRDKVPDGRWSRVEVVERRARVFDKSRLPDAILSDPRYYCERVTTYVRCFPVQVGGSRTKGPRHPTTNVELSGPELGSRRGGTSRFSQ